MILLYTLFVTIQCITIQTNKHCSCSELQSQDCTLSNFCYWDGEECSSYSNICESITKEMDCKAKKTNGICKWSDNQCEEHLQSCDEFTTEQDCICYWNLDNECAAFTSCSNYDQHNCPATWDCGFIDGVCKPNEYVTCSDQIPCNGSESQTTQCAINNDNECDAYLILGECKDFSDFKSVCFQQTDCKYQDDECVYKSCEDYEIQSCYMAYIDLTTKVLCKVSGNKCIESEDTQNFNIDSCHNQTLYNYKWSNQGCIECDSLEYSTIITTLSIIYLLI